MDASTAEEGEQVSALLIITVIVGTVLMTSLLGCYVCVFRQLCCVSDADEAEARNSRRCSSKRSLAASQQGRKDSIMLGELTHISSVPTESERI